jgi:hypothetical protein
MGAGSSSALSGFGDFFGSIAGSLSNTFKNRFSGASGLSSLFSSPILLVGGGCLVLYIFMQTKGSSIK